MVSYNFDGNVNLLTIEELHDQTTQVENEDLLLLVHDLRQHYGICKHE